jgi:VWFA-related protein
MLRVAFTLTLAASALLAQAPAGPLVRLYPVAVDASGQPVTDLTADDFKIVDQNKPESVFLFHGPKTEAPPPKLDVLEFSNRTRAARPHATVILFDLMNQNQPDRLEMWHVLDKSLPQLESGEFLYFYLLNLEGELVPIHAMGPRAADDATWPHDVAAALDKAMKTASHGRPVQLGQEDQAKKTFHQLEVLATQLALFPGRRDIVWIANGMQNAYNSKLPCSGDWVDCALYVPHLAVTLATAGVAVDPLSNGRDVATGTTAISGMDTPIGDKGQVRSIQGDTSNQQGAQGTDPALDLTQMARLTGGHAYFRQDIRTVVKQVATDANGAYEVAYAPSADNWDNKFHVIHVTAARPGVKVQVRERYYALTDSRTPLERTKAVLMEAFQSPMDYSEIGLRVKFAPLDGQTGVHLEIHVDPANLMLHHGDGGKYSGALYCLISDRNGSGPAGEPAVLELKPDLTADQYKSVLKDGLPIEQDHPTSAAQVRVIVLDENTNEVGSVTFPVK